jgi:hypothetical protein
VAGCAQGPAELFECAGPYSGSGTIEGTVTVSDGGYEYDIDTELRQCGWIDSSGRGGSASLTVEGNTLVLGGDRTLVFCVEEDLLWLYEEGVTYPDLTVTTMRRVVVDGGLAP